MTHKGITFSEGDKTWGSRCECGWCVSKHDTQGAAQSHLMSHVVDNNIKETKNATKIKHHGYVVLTGTLHGWRCSCGVAKDGYSSDEMARSVLNGHEVMFNSVDATSNERAEQIKDHIAFISRQPNTADRWMWKCKCGKESRHFMSSTLAQAGADRHSAELKKNTTIPGLSPPAKKHSVIVHKTDGTNLFAWQCTCGAGIGCYVLYDIAEYAAKTHVKKYEDKKAIHKILSKTSYSTNAKDYHWKWECECGDEGKDYVSLKDAEKAGDDHVKLNNTENINNTKTDTIVAHKLRAITHYDAGNGVKKWQWACVCGTIKCNFLDSSSARTSLEIHILQQITERGKQLKKLEHTIRYERQAAQHLHTWICTCGAYMGNFSSEAAAEKDAVKHVERESFFVLPPEQETEMRRLIAIGYGEWWNMWQSTKQGTDEEVKALQQLSIHAYRVYKYAKAKLKR